MKALVTGAGLVGSWAVRHLLDMGHTPAIFDVVRPTPWAHEVIGGADVEFFQGDISDFPDVFRAARESGCDAIIHTAALLTEAVRQRPFAGIRINILGSVNVLEAARLAGGLRVVFCSSSTVYTGVWDRYHDEIVPTDFTMKVLSDRPRSVYATAKLGMEWIGLNYLDAGYADFVAVRFQGVVGPWGGPLSGIPARIVKAIAEPAASGQNVILNDPLLLWRGVEEFVHASDAAMGAVLAAAAARPDQRVYSIGMGRAYALSEVLDVARRVFPGVRIEAVVEPRGGIAGYPAVRHQVCDAAPASDELGYTPQFDMERTFRHYADWLRRPPTAAVSAR